MKTTYLIRKPYDGGKSAEIAADLTRSGITFTSLMYGEEPLPWAGMSALPCVVIDVDGQIEAIEEHRPERPYDNTRLIEKLEAAPETKPRVSPPATETDTQRMLRMLESIETRLAALEERV